MSVSFPSPGNAPPGGPNSSGSTLQDIPKALKQVSVVDDFKRLPEIPCARNSLMYGIASGAGIGALRFLNSGPKIAANWAMGTFVFVSCAAWAVCRNDRANDLALIQKMIDKYPDRHVRAAKERAEARRALAVSGQTSNATTNTQ